MRCMGRMLFLVAMLPFWLMGCSRFLPPSTLSQRELQDEGILFGSFPHESKWVFKIRPDDPSKSEFLLPVYNCLICDRPPPKSVGDWLGVSRLNEPLRFCVKLPPGNYEFFSATQDVGNGEQRLTFRRTFSLAAGELKYVGELQIGDPFTQPSDKLIDKLFAQQKVVVSSRNQIARDAEAMSLRYPGIQWNHANYDASIFGIENPASQQSLSAASDEHRLSIARSVNDDVTTKSRSPLASNYRRAPEAAFDNFFPTAE